MKQDFYKGLVTAATLLSLASVTVPVSATSHSILGGKEPGLIMVDSRQAQYQKEKARAQAKAKAQAEAEAKAKEAAAAKAAEEAANPHVSRSEQAKASALENALSGNMYPWGQCTWGVKELAPWAHTYWGNGGDWAVSAAADGFTVGTEPVVGAIAVWTDPYGGYGHVAYVTAVESEYSIEVLEANIGGNPTIMNYRGFFDPTATAEGVVSYIYPVQG